MRSDTHYLFPNQYKEETKMSYILKAEELAGALDAFAEFFPQADIKVE